MSSKRQLLPIPRDGSRSPACLLLALLGLVLWIPAVFIHWPFEWRGDLWRFIR